MKNKGTKTRKEIQTRKYKKGTKRKKIKIEVQREENKQK